MKKVQGILLAMILVSGILPVLGQGMAFEHTSWAAVSEKAKASKKYIFVDVYAVWCGPCKFMTRDVFTDPQVGEFFNKNFVSFKVDGEKEEQDLVASIELEAFPTLLFFDPSGKLVKKVVGAMDAAEFLVLGENVVGYEANRAIVLQGKATRAQTINYLLLAKEADKENFEKVAGPLVKNFTLDELLEPEPWKIFSMVVEDATSAEFQRAVQNSAKLQAHEDFYNFIDRVMGAYFVKMATDGNLKGLDLYKKTMLTIYTQAGMTYEYNYFELQVNANYYLQREELKLYEQNIIKWVDTYFTDDWKKLGENAISLYTNVQNDNTKVKALQWATRAIELDRNKSSLYSLALVYESTGDEKKAIVTAEEILKLELSDEEIEFVNEYLTKLKS